LRKFKLPANIRTVESMSKKREPPGGHGTDDGGYGIRSRASKGRREKSV
jgi:hypothetical protein